MIDVETFRLAFSASLMLLYLSGEVYVRRLRRARRRS